MKNIFLDTNVVIDVLANRQPFSLIAAQLFELSYQGKIKIYISAVSYNNIYYILRQSLTHQETLKLLDSLSAMTDIIDITKAIIKQSIKSDFKDFEDALQYHCALSLKKIDCIVTRNARDFRKSSLSILSPQEALDMIVIN